MLTLLKMAHIIMPLFLGVVYIYFILLLNRYIHLSIGLISVFVIFWFLYALRTYALLHFRPKITKNIKEFNDVNTEKLFEYKRVEEKLKELKSLIRSHKRHQAIDIRSQYLDYYQQVSYCDYCESTKPPRAYHCMECNACVLRRQKHSQLTGFCIGEGNIKPFMQYMFIGMITSFYMTLTLIIVTIGEHHQLNEFTTVELLIFAFEEIALCSCLLLYLKEFTISYFNAKKNITETERKQGIINAQNNPFNKNDFYHELFHSNTEYFKINTIGDYSHWLDLHQTA